jgi:hypothetical protein
MDSIFHQIKQTLSRIQMTDVERARIRGSIAHHVAIHPRGTSSWWFSNPSIRAAAAGVFIFVVLIGSGTTISYASIRALPKDTLYGVKIFRENLIEQIKTDPTEKAAYQIARVENRIEEATTLAQRNQLDPKTKTRLAITLKEHIQAANNTTHEISMSSPSEALAVSTSLETSLATGIITLAAVEESDGVARTMDEHAILNVVADTSDEVQTTKEEVVTLVASQPANDMLEAEAHAKLAALRLQVGQIAASIGTTEPADENPVVDLIPTTPIENSLEVIDENVKAGQEPTSSSPRTLPPRVQKSSLFVTPVASAAELPAIPTPTLPSLEAIEFVAKLQVLLAQADTQLAAGQAGAALVTLQTIEQMIAEQQRLTQLEQMYQIQIPGKVINISISPESSSSVAPKSDGNV